MCAAAIVVLKCSGPVITVVKGCLELLAKMELNKIVKKRHCSKIKELSLLLSEVKAILLDYPEIQKKSKINMDLKHIDDILKQGMNVCNRLNDSTFMSQVRNTLQAESQSKTLDNLGHDLDNAQNTVQAALQLINCCVTEIQSQARGKENERILQSLNPQRGVFECCDGKPPLAVTNVVAEVPEPDPEADHVYLMISWNDCEENTKRRVNKYEVTLKSATATDWSAPFHCTTYSVKVTEQVKPWEKYDIKVRAMNDAGYGPWSEVLCNIVINKCPPKQPQLKDITYDAPNSKPLYMYITIQRTEEHNEQQVFRCILKQTHNDETVTCFPYPFFHQTNTLPMLIRIPPESQQCTYQIMFENKFGKSPPSEKQVTPVFYSLLPGKPQNVHVIEEGTTTTEVWLTWKQPKTNVGTIDSYKVEKCQLHSKWEEVPFKTGTDTDHDPNSYSDPDPLDCLLKDLKTDRELPRVKAANKLKYEDQELYRVIKNLKQDTPYQFRIIAVNKAGQRGQPSKVIQTKTKLPKAFEKAASLFGATGRSVQIIFTLLARTYQDSSSRIAAAAQFVLSMCQEQRRLLAPPTQQPCSESDCDSDSENDDTDEYETQM